MERKSLEEKLVSLQQQFDAMTKNKSDADAELYRLQGDYRTIQGLIEQIDKVELDKKEKKDATTSK